MFLSLKISKSFHVAIGCNPCFCFQWAKCAGKMSIHYKFKSAIDYDTITFDGLHISVSDLKKSIVYQKKLGKATDFDLMITNAQTNEGNINFLQ